MTQLSLFEKSLWTVSEITNYLSDMFENDYNLQDLWVEGEISNVRRPNSGHMYFTVKDGDSLLRCVMWRNAVNRQGFTPREGQAVEVHGTINIYRTDGVYQLYADLIRPAGEGFLYQEFLRLKARLEAEGLFAVERKREIPRWPQRIGIVTSATGAALRDMIHTLTRRYCLAEVVLSPTAVQGEEAPPGIVAALEALNAHAHPDVILLARGGGSIEDLWAFNDERVARAIARSAAPVICGVGHETDFTIADFVADLRAPTPTAAAELATPNRFDLQAGLNELNQRLGRAVQNVLTNQRWALNRLENRLAVRSPLAAIRTGRQRLDDLLHRAALAQQHTLRIERTRLQGLSQRLDALNPLAVLQRGYAIVTRPDGEVVRSVTQAIPGTALRVQVSDGKFGARVTEMKENDDHASGANG